MDRLAFHAFVKKHNVLLFPIAEFKDQLQQLFLSTARWEHLIKDRQDRYPYENYSVFEFIAEFSHRKGGDDIFKVITVPSKKRSTVYTTNTSLVPSLDSLDEHDSGHFGLPTSPNDDSSPGKRGSFGSISYQVEGSPSPHAKKSSQSSQKSTPSGSKKSDKHHKLNLHLNTPKGVKVYSYDRVNVEAPSFDEDDYAPKIEKHIAPPSIIANLTPKPAGDISSIRSSKDGHPHFSELDQPSSPATTVGSTITDKRRRSRS